VARVGPFHFGHLLRRPFRHDAAAPAAAFGTQNRSPSRRGESLPCCVNDQDAAAAAQEPFERVQQLGDVVEMQAGSGLVENVQRPLRLRIARRCAAA